MKALVWIVRPGPEVLLLKRPERRGGGEHPVTGKADDGEKPLACAEREAFEETGLRGDVEPLHVVHRYRAKKGDFEEHAFLLKVPRKAEPQLSSEHISFRWASPDEALAALHWKAHRETLEAALKKL
ncbi:MAG: NUDIX domain-containing protein [Myxococcales bacterium]|nr:NUDIX domain-containing protein [Myxococcales bacterium]